MGKESRGAHRVPGRREGVALLGVPEMEEDGGVGGQGDTGNLQGRGWRKYHMCEGGWGNKDEIQSLWLVGSPGGQM